MNDFQQFHEIYVQRYHADTDVKDTNTYSFMQISKPIAQI